MSSPLAYKSTTAAAVAAATTSLKTNVYTPISAPTADTNRNRATSNVLRQSFSSDSTLRDSDFTMPGKRHPQQQQQASRAQQYGASSLGHKRPKSSVSKRAAQQSQEYPVVRDGNGLRLYDPTEMPSQIPSQVPQSSQRSIPVSNQIDLNLYSRIDPELLQQARRPAAHTFPSIADLRDPAAADTDGQAQEQEDEDEGFEIVDHDLPQGQGDEFIPGSTRRIGKVKFVNQIAEVKDFVTVDGAEWDTARAARLVKDFENLGRLYFFTKMDISVEDRRAILVKVLGTAPQGTSSQIRMQQAAYDTVWRELYARSRNWKKNWQDQTIQRFAKHIRRCIDTQVGLLEMDKSHLKQFCITQYLHVDLSQIFSYVKYLVDFHAVANPDPPVQKVDKIMRTYVQTLYFNMFSWVRQILDMMDDEEQDEAYLKERNSIFSKARAFAKEVKFQMIEADLSWPRGKEPPLTKRSKKRAAQDNRSILDLDPEFEYVVNESDEDAMAESDYSDSDEGNSESPNNSVTSGRSPATHRMI